MNRVMTTTFIPLSQPFPHVVVDGHWEDGLLDAVVAEFPHPQDQRWVRFENEHEHKLGSTDDMWGPSTRTLFGHFADLAPALSEAFGIPDLSMETAGGGYHLIPPGGHLDVHVDFNRSPATGLYRRLNCLTFLNRGWTDPGGNLQLFSDIPHDRPVDIVPEFNRMVAFETSDRSWHGHRARARRWRLSVAAYFYSPEPPAGYREDHSTVWL